MIRLWWSRQINDRYSGPQSFHVIFKKMGRGIKLIGVSFLMSLSTLTWAGLSNGTEIGKFRNTWYCVALETEYTSTPQNQTIYDMDGNSMAIVHEGFKKELKIEGSGELLDGRMVNYAGVKDGEHRYRFTPNPYGDGVGNCALVPFHTIAVDPEMIPLGALVRIPETEGMILPDGSSHNGLWRAEDIGSAIKRDRIDIFAGAGHSGGKVLERHGIKNLQPLTVELVEEGPANGCVTQPPPAPPNI